jgi:hypothetical protein
LKRPNVAADFLDWSPIEKRFVKRLFSVLIFAKRLFDRLRVGGSNDRGHNRASYGVLANSATLVLRSSAATWGSENMSTFES